VTAPRSRVVAPALVGLLVAFLIALAGCASSPTSTASPAQPVGSPVIGVPIKLESEGFSKVKAFTIRTDAGQELRFVMGTLENGAEFPPNHLAEHLAGSTKVRVFYREEGGELVAYRLEDAEPAR
jgi:hypothetical protein